MKTRLVLTLWMLGAVGTAASFAQTSASTPPPAGQMGATVAATTPDARPVAAPAVSPTTATPTTPAAPQKAEDAKPADGGAATKPAAAQKPPAPPKPELTGLERLSDDWPKWLKVGVLYRGRVEASRSPVVKSAEYDGYYLNRLRLTASVRTSQWLQSTIQVQDAQALGYAVPPAPKSMANPLDLRLAYVDLGKKAARGVTAALGRQELTLSDGRLMASSDWGNVSKTYDAARVTGTIPGVKLDLFGGAPVDVAPTGFHRAKLGERLYGGYATFDKVKRLTTVEVYFLGKANRSAVSELGPKGDARLYTTGARITGKLVTGTTFDGGAAVQRGHYATDQVSAWALFSSVTWASARAKVKPRVTAEYFYASGDNDPKDGTRGTFDQLYSSNHGKYGLADHIGLRNMRMAAVKFEISPSKKLKLNSAVSRLQLATVNDSWYGSSGTKVVLNRKATGTGLGWETDLFATLTVSKELSLAAGIAGLFGGGYIEQSTGVTRIWSPYVMWTTKF